jgi:undecaprenyl-diphosphatase
MFHWRRKLEPTVLVGGLIVIAGLIVYGAGVVELPNAEQLIEDAGDALGKWTYVVVAVMAFLETGAFVGLIAPGETFMVFGGVVAGQGKIDLFTLIAVVWFAAVAGDVTSFYMGHRLGREFLVKHGPKFQITEERLETVEKFFDKHGGKAILIGRFVGLVRAIAPFLAGSSRMKLKRFLPYDIIGAGLWATTFVMLGYVFWQSFSTVANYAEKGALAFGSLIALIVGIVVAVRWLKVPANRRKLEEWVNEQFDRPLLRPVAAVLRPIWRVTDRPRRFFVERITPGNLGLEMTTLVAVAGVGLFAYVAPQFTLKDRAQTPADERAMNLVDKIHVSWLADVAQGFSVFGLFWLVGIVVVLSGIYAAYRRRYFEAGALVIGLGLTYALVHITKVAVDRPRPSGSLVETTGSSFPSGHAAYAIGWVAIALVLTRTAPGFARTTTAIVAASILALLVALSRIYLRASWLSDTTAGAGGAAAIFAGCAMVALVISHLRQNGREK